MIIDKIAAILYEETRRLYKDPYRVDEMKIYNGKHNFILQRQRQQPRQSWTSGKSCLKKEDKHDWIFEIVVSDDGIDFFWSDFSKYQWENTEHFDLCDDECIEKVMGLIADPPSLREDTSEFGEGHAPVMPSCALRDPNHPVQRMLKKYEARYLPNKGPTF